ncbi:hypothetical protein R1sor_016864 [Riccia sorocarpa]|uniref:Reverse transcriptase domain-containing protein n=1 Tax=Riccia sorocarpa TaxID=122646 RepID=A0ABD3HG43_9MARC
MCTPQKIFFCSWNLNGTAGELRGRTIHNRIRSKYKQVEIFAFQELKTKEFELENTLKLIAEGGQVVVDYRSDGWSGAALVLKPSIKIISRGVKGDGQAAWATFQTQKGTAGVMSLYAPQSPAARSELWHWIQRLAGEGNWVIGGDLNMVEWGEDTNCISPILSGDECYAWMDLQQDTNLVECYKGAARRSGPRFTRVQVKGNRVEMSRLDRWHLTNNGDWVDKIAHVFHDPKAGISDHCPVIMELWVVEGSRGNHGWKSYMKIAVDDLKDQNNRTKVVAAWKNHPVNCSDPRIRWDLAWRRVKRVLKDARGEKKAQEVSREDLESIHAEWRLRIETEDSEKNKEGLRLSLAMLKEKDHQEASLWKMRSQVKWLTEGDAPSKYFFAIWQSKLKHETIRSLQLEDGTVLEDRAGILQEIGSFYRKLYMEEGDPPGAVEERARVLSLITKQVKQEDNLRIETTPTVQELEDCVKHLAKDKAPGLDGVSADVLRELWDEAKDLCLEMLETFWATEQLTTSAKKGVIKIIPKNDDTHKLTNWRPLTLTGINYKLASKLLADRLKPLLPGLISGQQTGFVPGRTIFDNILALKLGEEWALETGQEAFFLKLDFIKAYDRIRHVFLWDTLKAMGFSDKVIKLFQGLMHEAEATVHHDGEFSEVFKLEREVRQGCPLAPFLFSLSTEPLMLMLQEAAELQRIEEIKISEHKQLLHSLFADDTGLCLRATEENFWAAKEIVDRFEMISGARLNVAKSLIIPLGLETVPRWMLMTGCKVAVQGELWTYLGAPVGVGVAEDELEAFLLEKLTKKINFWANRMLNWEGRCTVLKHALSMLPNYYLMTLGLTTNGYRKLDRTCWRFLWGSNKDGQPKKSLVSWERICQEKKDGGLGLTTFKNQAIVLKMRLVSRLLEGDSAEWTEIARAMLERDFHGRRANEGLLRSAEEILVLEKITIPKNSKTLSHILKGWGVCRAKLRLLPEATRFDKDMSIDLIYKAGELLLQERKKGWQPVKRRLKTMRITDLSDLQGRPLRRLKAADLLGELPDTEIRVSGPLSEAVSLLAEWVKNMTRDNRRITDPTQWSWDLTSDAKQTTWTKETKEWKQIIIPPYQLRMKANASWGMNWDTRKWETLWKGVWQGSMFPRDKMWVWRILNKAFFTLERGATIGVTTAICKSCQQATENVDHLFLRCPHSGNTDASSLMVNIRTRGRYRGGLRIAPRRHENTEAANTEAANTAEEEHSTQEEDRRTDRSAALEGRRPKENTRTVNEDVDRSSEDLETHQRRWWSMAQELELLGFREMELEEPQEHLLFHGREERT